ncbi:MAG: hypothetical protein JNM89_04390 [Hyphomicrobiaceae bacterium]|nr:hypothetical protein [Hyphomicrobiaceae bacterium]
MTMKKIVIASLAVTIAALGAVGSAEAGRRGGGFKGGGFKVGFNHHNHHFHNKHFSGPHVFVSGGGGGGCGYYFDKWKFTGSSFWKAKYYGCIG